MVSRRTAVELKKLGLEKWECPGCGAVEFRKPELLNKGRAAERKFCGVECFHLHAAKEREKYEELIKKCPDCGVEFRCCPSLDYTYCELCRKRGRPNRGGTFVDVECPSCGKVRKYQPAAAKKLKSDFCIECWRERGPNGELLVCSRCGKERRVNNYAVGRKLTSLCFECWQCDRSEKAARAAKNGRIVVCPSCGKTRRLSHRAYDKRKTDYCGACAKKRYFPPLASKPCLICGELTKNAKYCSVACRHKGLMKCTAKKCECCGKVFQQGASRTKTHKFCSNECRFEGAKNRVKFVCPVCGKALEIYPSDKRKTCSVECGFALKALNVKGSRSKKLRICPICRKKSEFTTNVICSNCHKKNTRNIINWRKAAKRAIVEHGNKKWRYAAKTKLTVAMSRIINEYFDEFNFLSMPHVGRELVALKELTKIDLSTSVGVEKDKQQFVALQAVVNRYFDGVLHLVYKDIDDFCLKTARKFDVAHLDYNGLLTNKHVSAINLLISSGTLVFFTVSQNHRYIKTMKDVVVWGDEPPISGKQLMKREYAGNNKVPMVTYCYIDE